MIDPNAPLSAADMNAPGPEMTTVQRDTPDPSESRRKLCTLWTERVQHARDYWHRKSFSRMQEDMRFCAGHQWDTADRHARDAFNEDPQDRYIANITLRHVAQRTAAIYGKNPKVIARTKRRLLAQVWDGSSQSLQTAMAIMQSGAPDPQALAILQDAQHVMQVESSQKKTAQSLELLMEHELDEQPQPFKVAMKATVRRGLTTGVGWVKLGYERVMQLPPDVDARIETVSRQLAALERLSADEADDEHTEDDPEAEQLRLILQQLQQTEEVVTREGLRLTYPGSTAIIPDTGCSQLRGFIGADWVAEEFFLSADKIKEIYHIDPAAKGASGTGEGGRAKQYARVKHGQFRSVDHASEDAPGDDGFFCVWEIYSSADGLVYTVLEGHPDFLLEPGEPDVYLERFYPWFPFLLNEVYDEDSVFPKGDVRLIRDMQMELNRSRQGLREHRIASRPKTYGRKGVLSEQDKQKLSNPTAHDHIELDGLQPQERIEDVLQSFQGPQINPAMYDPSPVFEDYLRVAGQHEAHMGTPSGSTATEASIAEGARETGVSATVDDLDEFLGELMRAAGAILLMETPPEKAKEVVGPGVVWPDVSRDEIAREIYLEVEAASTGRPNKQAEIQNAQAIFPLLMQVPGVTPEFLAKELLRRMDDRLDLSEAFAAGMPSVQMMNRAQQMTGAAPGQDPNAQGAEGGDNAPDTDPGQVNAAPRPPEGAPAPTPQSMGQPGF